MDEPRGCYAACNRSGRDRKMSHDFTYFWNLKNKINEHPKQKLTHRRRQHTGGCLGGGRWRDVQR